MLPVLNLGPVAVHTRGLVLLLGIWVALSIAEHFARRRAISADVIWNFGMLVLGTSAIGARLAYAAQYSGPYVRDPGALLSLSFESMAWPEGIAVGLLAGAVYLSRARVPLPDVADVLAPALAVLWAAAGLGALLSGDAYGRLTTMPWGVVLWRGFRHPVQAYELLAGAAVVLALVWLWPRAPYRGWIALVAALLLGMARLLVEGYRGDPAVIMGGLRVAQIWALVVALLAAGILYRREWLAECARRRDGVVGKERIDEPGVAITEPDPVSVDRAGA